MIIYKNDVPIYCLIEVTISYPDQVSRDEDDRSGTKVDAGFFLKWAAAGPSSSIEVLQVRPASPDPDSNVKKDKTHSEP